jgi:hypothetical protein
MKILSIALLIPALAAPLTFIVYAAHGLCAVNDKVPDCTGN